MWCWFCRIFVLSERNHLAYWGIFGPVFVFFFSISFSGLDGFCFFCESWWWSESCCFSDMLFIYFFLFFSYLWSQFTFPFVVIPKQKQNLPFFFNLSYDFQETYFQVFIFCSQITYQQSILPQSIFLSDVNSSLSVNFVA